MPGKGQFIKIDEHQFNTLLELHLRQTDIADFFNVSIDTLERYVKRNYKMKYAEYSEKKRSKLRRLLMQKFWEKVKDGNMTAIIFGLKNIMGWHDNVQFAESNGFNFTKKKPQ